VKRFLLSILGSVVILVVFCPATIHTTLSAVHAGRIPDGHTPLFVYWLISLGVPVAFSVLAFFVVRRETEETNS
jgi:hypothetical protein